MAKTKEELIETGQRWNSELVIKEATAALERWKEDLALLTKWGFGETKRKRLEELLSALQERHGTYKREVGAKLAATPSEANANENLRVWSQRALGVLDDLIQEDINTEKNISALGKIPTDSTALLTVAKGLHQIATDERARLDADAADDEFYAEGSKLVALLVEATKAKSSRRESKEVGTTELDLLDGQIYDLLSRLFKKARQAFNSTGNKTRAGQYVFQYLVRDSAPSEPTPPPQEPPA